MERGDKAVLFNGHGREITAELVEFGDDEVRFRKLHETEAPPPRCRITLGQAIPKGKNMELIVQKAVEIGASEIAPLVSERTIVTFARQEEARRKQAKWQQVAIEAAKQSGQNWLPQVRVPRKFKDFVSSSVGAGVSPPNSSEPARPPLDRNASSFELRLIGSLQSDAQHLKKILTDYQTEHQQRPASVLILIGPEGDFTEAELALAKSHSCLPITLGSITLRVETAAIYCLSVLSYELL
jgi:16S rRNA (uracil1498-N3)-methyltransferase